MVPKISSVCCLRHEALAPHFTCFTKASAKETHGEFMPKTSPRGSKYPNITALGPKHHSDCSIWVPNPPLFGYLDLRVTTGSPNTSSLDFCHFARSAR